MTTPSKSTLFLTTREIHEIDHRGIIHRTCWFCDKPLPIIQEDLKARMVKCNSKNGCGIIFILKEQKTS